MGCKSLQLVSEDLLSCIGKNKLIELTKKMSLKIKKNGIKSNEMISSIIHQINTQKTVFGVRLSNNPSFLKKCHSVIGEFIAINENAMNVLSKSQLLFYLDPNKSIHDAVLSGIGVTKYPKYRVFDAENNAKNTIFPTKKIFEEYRDALQERSEYDAMYLSYTQNKAVESEIIQMIKECTKKLSEKIKERDSNSKQIESSENSFLSKYRDIAVYSRLLNRGVTDVIEKLTDKDHELSCSIYRVLLSSSPFSYSRGKWFCRLALLIHHHLKQHQIAYTICHDALIDDFVELGDRNEIIKRYRKLHKHLGIKQKLIIPTPKSSSFLLNEGESFVDEKTFKYVHINGKPVNSTAGEKSRFFGYDDNIVSVEELVIQYFGLPENGNWNGIHCEGTLYRMIFGIFFWDIIFCDDVPFVFQTEFQSAPLDINTKWFYLDRRKLIESHLKKLSNLNDGDIEETTKQMWKEHNGESVIGVYWDQYDLKEFVEMCQAIGGHAIGQICLLLAKNYRYWSGGLPDLFLWRKCEKSDGFECKLVEVKGPRDKLSQKQNCWILYLDKYANLDVSVAKIIEKF